MTNSRDLLVAIQGMDNSTIITTIRILATVLADRAQYPRTTPAKEAGEDTRAAARLARLEEKWAYAEAFGERLRTARTQAGKTEAETAAACGVALKTYQRYEAGHPVGWRRFIISFAEFLDVRLDWLVGREGEMYRKERRAAPIRKERRASTSGAVVLPFGRPAKR